MRNNIPKISGLLVLALGVYFGISDEKYFTSWFGFLWSAIGSISLLQIEITDGKPKGKLPPAVQFSSSLRPFSL